MAAFHGKGGSMSFTGLTFELLSWTIDAITDMAEATDMGDTWKTYLAGFKDWTASWECVLPAAGFVATLATTLGSTDTLTITSGGKNYSGTAFCTGMSPSADKDDIGKLTFTFQGSGALAESA